MAKKLHAHSFLFLVLVIAFHVSLLTTVAMAASPRPISDHEIRMKKDECYADVESGMWGSGCKASMIAKENCALKCLSPPCYERVYERDPLEEGEKDLLRSQQYKYCMYKASVGESIEGITGFFE